MAYLLLLYRQGNSLKCRLRNKLLIDDIHIAISKGIAERTDKKGSQRQKSGGLERGECIVRNCFTWFNREIFLLM